MEERYLKVAILRNTPEVNVTEFVTQAFLYWSDDIISLWRLVQIYLNSDIDEDDPESAWTFEDIKKIPIVTSGYHKHSIESGKYWIEIPDFMDIRDYEP